MTWTTKIPGQNFYGAFFAPQSWPGSGPAFSLLLPECETQYIFPPGVPIINRPVVNKNPRKWARTICGLVAEHQAFLLLSADTEDQLNEAVRIVSKLLPKYARIPMERMGESTGRIPSGLH